MNGSAYLVTGGIPLLEFGLQLDKFVDGMRHSLIIGRLDMDKRRQTPPFSVKASEPKNHTAADARRERLQRSPTFVGQVARCRAAGAVPSKDEAARFVVGLHRRGCKSTAFPGVADALLKASARSPDRTFDPAWCS
ncbi:hypothetical protein [Paracraurococcus ruber]|uniref:hypothetical protein n=1 Tax=Paracraurococcus ruber TaxID=77675 RepID=UPI00105826CE|nr:hypothetical protein [Paracraurococcus ruber]TDG25023.1 hypothetical protein E2C05_25870 [Paracraurococcus ruber]